MHRILEDIRKNAPNIRGQKEKCTEFYRTDVKMHQILEDRRKSERNFRGQKEKCTEF
jgi:hypothetical protein